VNCPTCGAANREESRFCRSCGSLMGSDGPTPTVAAGAPARSLPTRPVVLAAVVAATLGLVIGGLVVMGSGGDTADSPPSAVTSDVVRESTEPSSAQVPPPTAVVTPLTPPPDTTGPPVIETAVETTVTPPPPSLLAPPTGFPFVNAFVVPQLGVEPVRGTGCGGDGSIGDVVPDGWWFGGVEDITSESLLLDLVCVFFGDEADARISECAATEGREICVAYWGGDFWPVNNTLRYRVVPVDPALVRTVDSTQGCSLADIELNERDELTWVHIVDGRAVHLQHLCPAG
jgi:hypothetical protein